MYVSVNVGLLGRWWLVVGRVWLLGGNVSCLFVAIASVMLSGPLVVLGC